MISSWTLIILTVIHPSISDEILSKPKPSPTPFHDFDYFVFSQRWPITGCSDWKRRSPKNTCNLPDSGEVWTIHGLWPTKTGANGPFFCPSAMHFDPDQLQPMLTHLEEFWPNIENNTKLDALWKHEWDKHGTCASALPILDSVTNYFQKGLQLNQEYNLGNMLAKSNIIPDVQGYKVDDIFNAITAATGKIPVINCLVEGSTKQSMINQIEICFDKDFDVIHCNVTSPNNTNVGNVMGNCSAKKNIMYLATVPNNNTSEFSEDGYEDEVPVEGCLEDVAYERNLLKVYGIIKFLIWLTL